MSAFKDTLKGGWHPKGKDGKPERSLKDQVTNRLPGRKKEKERDEEHIARPLATLKDPAAFGPPPKNVNYHGGAALPNQLSPDRGGWGAPLGEDIVAKRKAEREEEQRLAEEALKPKNTGPYRSDTTGLSTSHLPPPPGRKDGADGRSPVSSPPIATGPRAKPPSLPPRLPPRQNSAPISPRSPQVEEPDAHKGILNQGAMGRLGAAGVSVPAFGIESRKPPLPPPSSGAPANKSQLNELQSRFARLTPAESKPDSPSEGTTFAQKQAALKTASSFRNDPSSVSLSDARSAAGTANNFRERHGEQVKSGWQSANKINTKYGIADKVGSYGATPNPATPDASSPGTSSPTAFMGKKKPPPPPVKKAELSGVGVGKEPVPPPIPLSTKPRLGSYT